MPQPGKHRLFQMLHEMMSAAFVVIKMLSLSLYATASVRGVELHAAAVQAGGK